ncbi:hypothetical protein HPP92_025784 [Vanilla planifolia]|uniref:Uncharacterized protein n=1 Tax=Vanilla planifolia TaxID=51239 RepID=A0A835U8U1_VANPL|nr:hypothetical protein HPP92_026077 [Vanilla planifolia]KAG0452235.1 hypothetical protein HPP92_025784 [Vanilla planifolia]
MGRGGKILEGIGDLMDRGSRVERDSWIQWSPDDRRIQHVNFGGSWLVGVERKSLVHEVQSLQAFLSSGMVIRGNRSRRIVHR